VKTDRVLHRIWVEQNWLAHLNRWNAARPVCRRFSAAAAFVTAGWLSRAFPERQYVVEAPERAWYVKNGEVL
jgi:hypothetical protein